MSMLLSKLIPSGGDAHALLTLSDVGRESAWTRFMAAVYHERQSERRRIVFLSWLIDKLSFEVAKGLETFTPIFLFCSSSSMTLLAVQGSHCFDVLAGGWRGKHVIPGVDQASLICRVHDEDSHENLRAWVVT